MKCSGASTVEREVRTARGGGLPWWSVGFGFVEYIGINRDVIRIFKSLKFTRLLADYGMDCSGQK
ncbi:hypothetical protein NC652_029140 [Populus alba x Populus x berolinensis]|nr:hypothetical protein NC652_029140 [Populus alba x Populus x berolinensis]